MEEASFSQHDATTRFFRHTSDSLYPHHKAACLPILTVYHKHSCQDFHNGGCIVAQTHGVILLLTHRLGQMLRMT